MKMFLMKRDSTYHRCVCACDELCRSLFKASDACRKVFIQESTIQRDDITKKTLISLEASLKGLQSRKESNVEKRTINLTNVYRVNKVILDTMKDMERALLVVENYEARIKIGKYMVVYAPDNVDKEKAYIDFLGWTYCLLGDHKAAQESIEKGIALIERDLKSETLGGKGRMVFEMVRALRHLGSDEIESAKNPDVCLDFLRKASDLTNDQRFIAYSHQGPSQEQECKEMRCGLEYGVALAHFNKYLLMTKHGGCSEEALGELKLVSEAVVLNLPKAKEFKNQHRYFKWLILGNEVRHSVHSKRDSLLDDARKEIDEQILGPMSSDGKLVDENDYIEDYKTNLSEMNKIIKSSIYNDDVMVSFFIEKKEAFGLALNEVVEGEKR
jgi:tetratricopeptide (TPR) repeat protein